LFGDGGKEFGTEESENVETENLEKKCGKFWQIEEGTQRGIQKNSRFEENNRK